MNLRCFVLLWISVFLFATTGSAQEYYGNVGKMEATFFLKWDDSGAVSGEYWYPERKGEVYTLIGENREKGKLFLREFTGNERTANCILTKRITEKEVIWEGRMENTDGRKFDMALKRRRDNALPMTEKAISQRKIQERVTWKDYPSRKVITERVEQGSRGGMWLNGKTTAFRSTNGVTQIDFSIDERDGQSGEVIDLSTKRISLTLPRELPLPAASIIGKNVILITDASRILLDVWLTSISITHWRKTPGGEIEVRGFLDSDQTEELDMKPLTELNKILPQLPMVTLIPDKLALTDYNTKSVFGRVIRLHREFGVVIQMTDAGPGSLELESLSLEAPLDEIPWIFIGKDPGGDSIPATQKVREAG